MPKMLKNISKSIKKKNAYQEQQLKNSRTFSIDRHASGAFAQTKQPILVRYKNTFHTGKKKSKWFFGVFEHLQQQRTQKS